MEYDNKWKKCFTNGEESITEFRGVSEFNKIRKEKILVPREVMKSDRDVLQYIKDELKKRLGGVKVCSYDHYFDCDGNLYFDVNIEVINSEFNN